MDKTDKNTIEELLPRYCEGLATEEERREVEMWMYGWEAKQLKHKEKGRVFRS